MNEALVAEQVARESYGRILALLCARTRNVAAAEDALGDAFAAALTAWPRTGVPDAPDAWLFAAAKRRLIDAARRARTAVDGQAEIIRRLQEVEEAVTADPVPDHRLGLMFTCAHPAIDPAAHTALMLQVVLGVSADRIAAAFLMAPAAMGQRLVRAKKKIRDAGIGFEVPEPETWSARLPGVLDAIYAAYSMGWSDPLGADPDRHGLAREAIWLGRVLAAHLPDEPEALGLLALMLHLEARQPARRDAAGRYVPLDEQDTSRWRRGPMLEAEAVLRRASANGRIGRYQIEAAIQSAHAARAFTGRVDWHAVVLLYQTLADLTGSPVAHLNLAAALARRDGPAVAFARLEWIGQRFPTLDTYQPYWALRADLTGALGQCADAERAYTEAVARERDIVVRAFLEERRQRLRVDECARQDRSTS